MPEVATRVAQHQRIKMRIGMLLRQVSQHAWLT